MSEHKQGVFLRALAADSTEAVIDVVGIIGWDVWYPQMRAMLAAIPENVTRVVFDIYSPGGDVWEGNAIVQEIGRIGQTKQTVARVQVAASMATVIAMACNERTIAANGRWLVHNPWTAVQGDSDYLAKRSKELADAQAELAKFYSDRTGQTVEQMTALMGEERWLTPDEAQAFGFVQVIDNPFSATEYASVRAEIETAGKWPKALVEIPTEEAPEHANDDTQRPAVDASVPPVEPAAPAVDADAERVAAEYQRGVADGSAAGRAEAMAEQSATVDGMRARVAACEKLIRELQSAKDRAEARLISAEKSADERCAKMREQLENLTARLSKFVDAAAAFSPSVETWEEAMQKCAGDYAKARAQYPDLFKQMIATSNKKK